MTLAIRRAEDLAPLRRWLIFAAIMAPYVAYAFCWNTENFLRPYIAESLRLSRTQVSALYTAQALGALLGAVLLSQLADRRSRHDMYAVVAATFGIASLCVVFVHDYPTALAQRFVMGFFLGGVFGCAVSLYVGLFPPQQRGLLAGIVQLVYNAGDALLAWFGRHYSAGNWQAVLEIGGAAAIAGALLMWLSVPDDRRMAPWGGAAPRRASTSRSSLAVYELFVNGRWSLTLRLALLCGLNFFAFQAFNGWVTTYLRESQRYAPDLIGRLMTVVHVGAMIGAIVWGLLADRLGRRFGAVGLVLSAAFILTYLNVPPSPELFALVGFAYGFAYVCTGVWGPYFAELYPEHLRATAASIFNWGRVVSLFGALLAGAIAEIWDLRAVMYLGAATFAVAAVLWWSLPETLPRRSAGTAPRDTAQVADCPPDSSLPRL